MRAELEVSSGRPNPAWELTDAEVDALAARLRRLRTPGRREHAAPALGYRGIAVANPEAHGGQPAHIHVFDGVVHLTGDGGKLAFEDTEDVEAFLLDSARRHGHGAMLDDLAVT